MSEFLYHKPSELGNYTNLCIYIDENMSKIVVPGENPDIENKIYNYLWLLIKALAIKKRMFQSFEDYDSYAFYTATRVFFALRKNQTNQGKIIKGKEIKPIKSCLNYTKAIMYPAKLEFQAITYRAIIDEEFVSKKFNAIAFNNTLRDYARSSQTESYMFPKYLKESLSDISGIIDKVLKRSPFPKDSVDYKRLKISILFACNSLMNNKKKLSSELGTVTLWNLPKSTASYVKVLVKEVCKEIQQEIINCYESVKLDDSVVDKILSYREGSDYDYDE